MILLFFDVETTGLPIFKPVKTWSREDYYHPSDTDKYDSSRIVELAYLLYDTSRQEVIDRREFLIKPSTDRDSTDYFVLTPESTAIHGITNEALSERGVSFSEMNSSLARDLERVDVILAYNSSFDVHVLLSECHRRLVSPYNQTLERMSLKFREDLSKILISVSEKTEVCVMTKAKRVLRRERNLKLIYLYDRLFVEPWVQKHRALDDVERTLDCWLRLCSIEAEESSFLNPKDKILLTRGEPSRRDTEMFE